MFRLKSLFILNIQNGGMRSQVWACRSVCHDSNRINRKWDLRRSMAVEKIAWMRWHKNLIQYARILFSNSYNKISNMIFFCSNKWKIEFKFRRFKNIQVYENTWKFFVNQVLKQKCVIVIHFRIWKNVNLIQFERLGKFNIRRCMILVHLCLHF